MNPIFPEIKDYSDIEKTINNENFDSKVTVVLKTVYEHKLYSELVEIPILFEKLALKSIGHSFNYTTLEAIKSFNDYLEESKNIYKNTIMPLVIQALNCHSLAFSCFHEGGESKILAGKHMKRAGEIAPLIAEELKKMDSLSNNVRDKVKKILMSMETGHLFKFRSSSTNPTALNLVKNALDSMQASQLTMFKISQKLLQQSCFYDEGTRLLSKLEDPISKKNTLGGIYDLGSTYTFKIINLDAQNNKTVTNIPLNMKTSREISTPNKKLEVSPSELAINEKFKEFYVAWLSFSKATLMDIETIEVVQDQMIGVNNLVTDLQNDPLAKALNATA